MSDEAKSIDIKNCTYYFFEDININTFDLSYIKIDEKSYIQRFSYLLYWISDDKRFEICKN